MIVVIAGMPRSGSTFSFNVARELLNARGEVATFATNSLLEVISNPRAESHLIIKTHAPDHLTNSLLKKDEFPCICTVRKPEDAIASWMQVFRFSFEESVDTYRHWLAWHSSMSQHMLNLRYEELDKFPLLTIWKISRYLLTYSDFREVSRIWWKYRKRIVYEKTKHLKVDSDGTTNLGFSYYDNLTFFHRRHISSIESLAGTDVLSEDQIRLIRDGLNDYVDKNGNYHW